MIYHIVAKAYWETFAEKELYFPADYEQEGFIHCSKREQVKGSVLKHFQGIKELLLLHLDESKITSKLIEEPSRSGKLFPHIYGGLNKDAVVKIEVIDRDKL